MSKRELEHIGVKGMRWGVRKLEDSQDHIEVADLLKKPRSKLTNIEIRKINDRLGLEQNHLNLKIANRTKAITIVRAATAAVGTLTAAYAIVTSPAGQKVISRIAKILRKAKKATEYVNGGVGI